MTTRLSTTGFSTNRKRMLSHLVIILLALQSSVWMETLASPRKVSPIEEFAGTLFKDGKTSYLIWIEPNTYTHVYDIDELRQIATVETLYEGKDGGVYKLFPPK